MSIPKQVIIARTDLNMRKGKLASQCAHASMAVLTGLMPPVQVAFKEGDPVMKIRSFYCDVDSALNLWLEGAFTKIVVGVNSEEELLSLYQKTLDSGILCSLIKDNGVTEFHGVATYTAVALGPDYPEVLDNLTGHLKLL